MTYDDKNLKITEIFFSIQGETRFIGYPCIFIRTAGCNLECNWCDTEYAKEPGKQMEIEDIIKTVSNFPADLVMITGGEPLCQKQTPYLINELLEKSYKIILETNGSFPLVEIPNEVYKAVDVKCPGSGEEESFLKKNLERISENDELNFVLLNRQDYDWACSFIKNNNIKKNVNISFTPAYNILKPKQLAEWLIEDGLSEIRLSLQLHKIIWGDRRGV
ncbi:MAG: radical SAM protein [Acidobacteria bacterium]|nr:radical SAM protein [Acidobacteriota bacterium]